MSSSTHRRRGSRHREEDRKRCPDPTRQDEVHIPRSYSHEADPYVVPEEELGEEMSTLQLNSDEIEIHPASSNARDPSRRTRYTYGKGKEKQWREQEARWSEWTWSAQHQAHYRSKRMPSGEHEYEYHYPSPTSAIHDGSHSHLDNSYYTTGSSPYGMQDSSRPQIDQPPSFSPSRDYVIGPSSQSSSILAGSLVHSLPIATYSEQSSHHTEENVSIYQSSGGVAKTYSTASHPSTNDTAESFLPSSYTSSTKPSTQPYEAGELASATSYSSSNFNISSTIPYVSTAPGNGYEQDSPVYKIQEAYNSGYEQSASASQTKYPPVILRPPIDLLCGCGTKKKLCGVIIWPKPKEPQSSDGKIIDSEESERPKNASSRSASKPDKVVVKGPDGKSCGPLYLPGILPAPPPRNPSLYASQRENQKYTEAYWKWAKGYEEWSQITCPCGYGYFNSEGVWISGEKARESNLLNPLWKETGGKAPPAKSSSATGPSDKKAQLRLYERDPERSRSSR